MERTTVLKDLSQRNYIHHGEGLSFWHGRLLVGKKLRAPKVTWQCPEKPRDDHGDAPRWLTANEYQDHNGELDTKLDGLVKLLMMSQKTVVYTGAGISRAAGIGQAARGRGGSGNKTTTATPTITHYALTALYQQSYVHSWIQQNHDGLPQKAGFPQECINEAHGSWYDPSNPVVVYSGNLKDRECRWMAQEAASADLVLVLGTSLGGLNADRVAHETSWRSLRKRALGTVMINLQQTAHDGSATIRLFGDSDVIMTKLLNKLGITLPSAPPATTSTIPRRVLVPYNADGERCSSPRMWLDLSPGAKIRMTKGHNIAGAGQPAYSRMKRIARPSGHVVRWRTTTQAIEVNLEGVGMLLGQWWVDAAKRGGPETLPIANVSPEYEVLAAKEVK